MCLAVRMVDDERTDMNHTKTEPTEDGMYAVVKPTNFVGLCSLDSGHWYTHYEVIEEEHYGLPIIQGPIEFIGPLVPLVDSPPEPSWTAWGGVPTCPGRWMREADHSGVQCISTIPGLGLHAPLTNVRYYGPIPEPAEEEKAQLWDIHYTEKLPKKCTSSYRIGSVRADTESEALANAAKNLEASEAMEL